MITARPQKDLRTAKQYFCEHLSQGDYYAERQQVAGYWFGRGAERLGLDLNVPVDQTAFTRLCNNLHPRTGEQLTVRQRKVDRRVFYDFVVSAPKSVSVLALTLGDERLVAAHDAAVRTTLAELEKMAATRVRRGGKSTERVTGELVTALFRHDSSRALDPQLHTHLVTFNATWDATEQRWKALQSMFLFDHLNFYTEVYRSELAVGVRRLGYELRPTAHGFEIEGVAPEVIAQFSKRRRAIVQAEATLTQTLGKPLTNDGRAKLAQSTRAKKRRDISGREVIAAQQAELSPMHRQALTRLVATARQAASVSPMVPGAVQVVPSSPATPLPPNPTSEAAIDFARDHLFERRSVVPRHEFLQVALEHSRGLVTLRDLQAALAQRRELIEVEGSLTTRTGLAEERRMISLVNAGAGRFRPLNPGFVRAATLSEEQQLALNALLRSPDQVLALRGGAGAGKTELLTQAVHGIATQHEVVLMAPTSGATDVLRKAGFPEAKTVQRFLAGVGQATPGKGSVIAVDEAGQLANEQMLALLELAARNQWRLLLAGDTRQHGSIAAGDALRILETQSTLRTVEVHAIRRQVDQEYRTAIAELAAGRPLAGLVRLERLGAVLEVPDEDRYQRLAADYVASVTAGKSALIVSPTWREIKQVTDEVRARLQRTGLLGTEETPFIVHRSLKWTTAQKRELTEYRAGQILTFHKQTKQFRAGEATEVVRASAQGVVVRRANHSETVITRKQARCFDVAEAVTLPVARGDRLLLQRNQQPAGLLNGQVVTVRKVTADRHIVLDDGRVIPPEFRSFTHGYCVTSPGAQGKTVDHVYVAVDSHTRLAAHEMQFYVSVSRGRERVKIYTDKIDALREAVQRPGTRLAATELLQRARRRVTETPAQRVRAGVTLHV